MGFIYLFFSSQLCCPLRFQKSLQTCRWEGFLVFGNFSSFTTPSLGRVSIPNSFVSFFIFYILPYLLLKTVGCLSGCLVSSASVQKLFCGICSAFKWSFDEFMGEKVVSPSYSSAVLGPPPPPLFFCVWKLSYPSIICWREYSFPIEWTWNPGKKLTGSRFISEFSILFCWYICLSWKLKSLSLSDSLWPHGLYSPWMSPGQNTGVGSLSFLQGIFPTQETGVEPRSPTLLVDSLPAEQQGKPKNTGVGSRSLL